MADDDSAGNESDEMLDKSGSKELGRPTKLRKLM